MNILLALLPVSLLLLALAVWAFLWAVRRGQFDDLDTPPLDILGTDDDRPAPPSARTHHSDAPPRDEADDDAPPPSGTP